jgi:hypothetical protein
MDNVPVNVGKPNSITQRVFERKTSTLDIGATVINPTKSPKMRDSVKWDFDTYEHVLNLGGDIVGSIGA